MKTAKLLVTMSLLAALPTTAAAQISPFVKQQVEAVSLPCADLAGASANLPEVQSKAVAIAALEPCYKALTTLDAFEKENGRSLTAEEINYFYYVGGNLIWITAASETMKNDGRVNQSICRQVMAAEATWGNVNVVAGSEVDIEMRTHQLRSMLLPVCNTAP